MDNAHYIAEGQRQLSDAWFFEPIDIDFTGEVIQS